MMRHFIFTITITRIVETTGSYASSGEIQIFWSRLTDFDEHYSIFSINLYFPNDEN